jgi:hypothetical protein
VEPSPFTRPTRTSLINHLQIVLHGWKHVSSFSKKKSFFVQFHGRLATDQACRVKSHGVWRGRMPDEAQVSASRAPGSCFASCYVRNKPVVACSTVTSQRFTVVTISKAGAVAWSTVICHEPMPCFHHRRPTHRTVNGLVGVDTRSPALATVVQYF